MKIKIVLKKGKDISGKCIKGEVRIREFDSIYELIKEAVRYGWSHRIIKLEVIS